MLGFDVVSLSGGEPLLYDGLGEVLQAARHHGCRINLVSNGILVASSRYRRHVDKLDAIALSVDGLPARHNRIRGSDQSFDQVRRAAEILRSERKPFGLIHTMTSESLDEIETLAQIAVDWGARLLQLHPFEAAGRGLGAAGMTALDADQRRLAYLLAAVLRVQHPGLLIQLDLVHRDVARQLPEALLAAAAEVPAVPNELVLEEDGSIVPISYGLARQWAITRLDQQRLAEAWAPYLQTRWPLLRRRLRTAASLIASGRHGDVAAWHPLLRRVAEPPLRRSGRKRPQKIHCEVAG